VAKGPLSRLAAAVPTVVDSATVKQACAFCRQRKKRCPHLVATAVIGPKTASSGTPQDRRDSVAKSLKARTESAPPPSAAASGGPNWMMKRATSSAAAAGPGRKGRGEPRGRAQEGRGAAVKACDKCRQRRIRCTHMRTPGRGTGEANGRMVAQNGRPSVKFTDMFKLTDMFKSTKKSLMLPQSLFEGRKHKGAVDGSGAVAGSGYVDGAGRKWGMDESTPKPHGSPHVKMEGVRDCTGGRFVGGRLGTEQQRPADVYAAYAGGHTSKEHQEVRWLLEFAQLAQVYMWCERDLFQHSACDCVCILSAHAILFLCQCTDQHQVLLTQCQRDP
jgi:hypothetical protein